MSSTVCGWRRGAGGGGHDQSGPLLRLQPGSHSMLPLWLTGNVSRLPDTGPLSLLSFPWVPPAAGHGSGAVGSQSLKELGS